METIKVKPVSTYATDNCEAHLICENGLVYVQVTVYVARLMEHNGGKIPVTVQTNIPIGMNCTLLDVLVDPDDAQDIEDDTDNTLSFSKGD